VGAGNDREPRDDLTHYMELTSAYASLRRELTTVFGAPIIYDGQTWNDAMLKHIADARAAELRQAAYVLDLAQQMVGAAQNLRGRLSS
jgi:hypothetical protein